ncbi:MAG: pentapeptide repeat-containing protein, partial [Myxococcales bacterium]|nr:pentapeptide repeat-containing protein [Myxococcales bacterium]
TEPPAVKEDVPRLDDLLRFPAGLSRIVRKCTVKDPDARYPSVTRLLADIERYGDYENVGLAHKGVTELNRSGLSTPPVKLDGAVAIPSMPARAKVNRGTGDKEKKPKREGRAFSDVMRIGSAVRSALLIVGLSVAAAGAGMAYLVGSPRVAPILFLGGALVFGFGLSRGGGAREPFVRVISALLLGALGWVASPVPLLTDLRVRDQLQRGTVSERVHAFQELVADGHARFLGVDFSGARLIRQTFFRLDMSGANFQGADLTDSSFVSTRLRGTNFTGAILDGVSFSDVDVSTASGFGSTSCDDRTRLPSGWVCIEFHPVFGEEPPVEDPSLGKEGPGDVPGDPEGLLQGEPQEESVPSPGTPDKRP